MEFVLEQLGQSWSQSSQFSGELRLRAAVASSLPAEGFGRYTALELEDAARAQQWQDWLKLEDGAAREARERGS